MPRKHKYIPHTYYKPANSSNNKKRFKTKQEAQKSADYQMLLNPNIELYVYQDIDGGWYLTRSKN